MLGGDVHDPPAHLVAGRLPEHLPHRRAREDERPAQVHGHHGVEVGHLRVDERLRVAAGDGRVVDEHVEPPGAVDGDRDQPLAVLGQGDVRGHVQGAPARRRDHRLGRVASGDWIPADVGADDVEAVRREPDRDRAADARGRARHDGAAAAHPPTAR
jgi:hypothetical protein